MNLNKAIEQAEFLDSQGTNGLADFIRQQQAEIEALKAELHKYKPQIWEVMKRAQK
jgi:hypothetical protein